MSTAARQTVLSPQEYLALERAAEYKSEYLAGEIYAMSGASRRHNLVTLNIAAELRQQLRSTPCETYTGEMRVQVAAARAYFYPDVVVVCGEPRFEDTELDTLLNPTVIVEVLSPSTERFDRGRKFLLYRQMQSLQEYVLVAQDAMRVEVFRRQGEMWLFHDLSGTDAVLRLESVGCELPLRAIYERVDLTEPAEDDAR